MLLLLNTILRVRDKVIVYYQTITYYVIVTCMCVVDKISVGDGQTCVRGRQARIQ